MNSLNYMIGQCNLTSSVGTKKNCRTNLPKLYKGLTFNSPIHKISNIPVRDKDTEKIIKPTDPIVYLYDENHDEHFTGFVKELNPRPKKANAQEYKLIVRNIIKEKRVVYLEERVCVGDLVFVQAQKPAEHVDQIYSRFLSYDVFIDCENVDKCFLVELGDFVQATIYEVNLKHKGFHASPLQKITKEEFEENENKIIRMDL